jgi:hypothetical protein
VIDRRLVIPELPSYQLIDPLFEPVRIALAHRGDVYSASYIQGLSGSAFRIGGICPCAPTCDNAMWPQQLLALLGYDVQMPSMEGAGITWEQLGSFAKLASGEQLPSAAALTSDEHRRAYAQAHAIIEAVKREVAAGKPVLVWHAFSLAEFDIVCGYDPATRQFIGRSSFRGHKGDYIQAGEARCLGAATIGGWPAAIIIGEKKRNLDAVTAETAAIAEAIRHARSQKNVDKLESGKWEMLAGIAAYERWARDFETPGRKRELGDAYCFGVYHHTHRHAAPFLREIAPRYPAARASLLAAAEAFAREGDTLGGGGDLLWWQSPAGPDAARNAQAAALLRDACNHYKEGISALETALPLMKQP